jgi:hypothetical protein
MTKQIDMELFSDKEVSFSFTADNIDFTVNLEPLNISTHRHIDDFSYLQLTFHKYFYNEYDLKVNIL